jgi:hypothetical protein
LEKGRRGEKIIELSNNRIIESVNLADAAVAEVSHEEIAENAEDGTDAPQAEESLSNHNSIIRTFDYSIIDSFPVYANVVELSSCFARRSILRFYGIMCGQLQEGKTSLGTPDRDKGPAQDV